MAPGIDLPQPTAEALTAYRDLRTDLLQWAATVHELVRERIAALAEANGPTRHVLETVEEYAERVLARGQHPFPAGECIYDDLNNNTGYGNVEVGYAMTDDDGGAVIRYSGTYPQWDDAGETYELRIARIYCPAWLITEPDGVERYRQQTSEMVTALRAELLKEDQALDALLAGFRREPLS